VIAAERAERPGGPLHGFRVADRDGERWRAHFVAVAVATLEAASSTAFFRFPTTVPVSAVAVAAEGEPRIADRAHGYLDRIPDSSQRSQLRLAGAITARAFAQMP